jgi:hypothetical protein
MRITKSIASDVARQICNATIGIKKEALEIEIKSLGLSLVLAQINDDLKKAFKKHNEYFQKTSSINFMCGSLSSIHVYLPESIPSTSNYSRNFVIEREEYEKMLYLETRLKSLKDERETMYSQIESTLCSLGTSKKVEEQFPEAAAFLPTESTAITSISVPIHDIRDMMKKYADKEAA